MTNPRDTQPEATSVEPCSLIEREAQRVLTEKIPEHAKKIGNGKFNNFVMAFTGDCLDACGITPRLHRLDPERQREVLTAFALRKQSETGAAHPLELGNGLEAAIFATASSDLFDFYRKKMSEG